MDDSGNFVVAWHEYVNGRGDEVKARQFDFFGSPMDEVFTVNSHMTSNQVTPDVAVSSDGDPSR